MIANLLIDAYPSFYSPHQQASQKSHHQTPLSSIHLYEET